MEVSILKVETTLGTLITHIVTDESKQYCYEIERTLKESEGDKGIIVGLYPTLGSTDSDVFGMDMTTMHLITHMKELNLKSVKIINLFSKISKGARMSSRNLQVDTNNLEHIEKIMKQKDFSTYKVILAYGSSMSSSIACAETKRIFLKLFKQYNPTGKLYQITADDVSLKNEKATHILFMGIRYSNKKWKLEEFKVTPDLLVEPTKQNSKQKTTDKSVKEKDKKKGEEVSS